MPDLNSPALLQVGGDVMEDAKYRCNFSEDLARSVAQNVAMDLETYVLYA